MQARWDRRFFQSTRGRVVALLRRRRYTVDELAQQLDVTDNAVRSHLAALERDGLVHQQGVRRGVRKPAYDYALTPEADALFPKAYEQVLRQMLLIINQDLGPDETEQFLQRVGKQLAAAVPPATGSNQQRLDGAIALLEQFGGLAEVERSDDHVRIRGFSCPLAGVTAEHPEVCGLVATMLEAHIGAPVCEMCSRGERPSCMFDVHESELAAD